MKQYVYIVVRKDIKPCNYAPQIAHAALEAGYASEAPEKSTYMVVLQVPNKAHLNLIAYELFAAGIDHREFHEGFANMGLTALATLPTEKLEDTILQKLELFKYTPEKEQKVNVKQDPHGMWSITDMPVLEEDPDNLFATKVEAEVFYRKKFG